MSGLICAACDRRVNTLYGWGAQRCWDCLNVTTEEDQP